MSWKEITEGRVVIRIPERGGVFYNPEMEITRDIDVATLNAIGVGEDTSYIDALAASGIRGIRVAKEVGIANVTINDRSRVAFDCILENTRLNGLDATVVRDDCRILLLRHHYGIVDLDPFGSPSWILDAASSSVNRILLVTATDTAPLCGSHRGGIQKYDALPLNTEYHREVGLRILLGRVARDLARHEKAMYPLLSYAKRHFIRLILEVEHGARKTDDVMRKMGYILHCFGCGFRSAVHDLLEADRSCPRCERRLRYTGVLYLGRTFREDLKEPLLSYLTSSGFRRRSEEIKLLERLFGEMDLPFFYDHHILCRRVGVTPSKIEDFINELRGLGFAATRTHLSGRGFKTDAPLDLIEDLLRDD